MSPLYRVATAAAAGRHFSASLPCGAASLPRRSALASCLFRLCARDMRFRCFGFLDGRGNLCWGGWILRHLLTSLAFSAGGLSSSSARRSVPRRHWPSRFRLHLARAWSYFYLAANALALLAGDLFFRRAVPMAAGALSAALADRSVAGAEVLSMCSGVDKIAVPHRRPRRSGHLRIQAACDLTARPVRSLKPCRPEIMAAAPSARARPRSSKRWRPRLVPPIAAMAVTSGCCRAASAQRRQPRPSMAVLLVSVLPQSHRISFRLL